MCWCTPHFYDYYALLRASHFRIATKISTPGPLVASLRLDFCLAAKCPKMCVYFVRPIFGRFAAIIIKNSAAA